MRKKMRWLRRLLGVAPCGHRLKHLFFYSFIWGSYAECELCGDHPLEEEL